VSAFTKEWQLLQNQYDSYEKYSLLIKLFSVATLLFSLAVQLPTLLVTLLVMVIWLQEGIWKTFQARIEQRLITIEHSLQKQSLDKVKNINGTTDTVGSRETIMETDNLPLAFQYNSEFLKQRPSTLGLIKEYMLNALRPTVAFPHAVLVLLALCF